MQRKKRRIQEAGTPCTQTSADLACVNISSQTAIASNVPEETTLYVDICYGDTTKCHPRLAL